MGELVTSRLSEATLFAMGLPEAGITYVIETGISPPARKVGRKRRRNLILEVPMKSVPVLLQAESLTGEFLFLVELDRREDLVAVFDQPITITVEIVDSIGRHTRTKYTADYLVVDGKGVTAYEIKADHELERLMGERKQDWTFDADGYRYLPAEKRFKAMGINHLVVPTSSLSSLRADNLRLLASSRMETESARYRKARMAVKSLLEHETTIRIGEILERFQNLDATAILQLIDREEAFVDLDNVTLSEPDLVWISLRPELAKIAQESDGQLRMLLAKSRGIDTSDFPDPRYHLEIATRLAIVNGTTRLNRKGELISDRTIRRYKKQLRDNDQDPLALEPLWANCGSSDPLISNLHHAFLTLCIRLGKGDKTDSAISTWFGKYRTGFAGAKESLGFYDSTPVCRSSFYNHWHTTPLEDSDSHAKGGRRLENVQADSSDPFSKTILATRPFSVAHIDHWKVDLHLVVGHIGGVKITRRPWLTAMVDSFTGEILALWLSFANPSKKACTMVVRDCVRRHGRLPEILITDGGSEFKSAHYLVMLATLKVIRCERPPEDPRFGKEVERVFGEFKQRFAKGLPGFGLSIERCRSVSAAFKAHKNAQLTLLEAFEALEAFVFRGYNNSPKPGTLRSRHALREQGLARFPTSGMRVTWDLKFLIATSIEPPGSSYTLWTGRGIHLADKWYSSPRLLEYRGYKKDFSVRVEPFADSIIYVCIEGKWLVCANSDAPIQFATPDRNLISCSAERQDLAALREELANEMNQCAAEIVNEKITEIAARARGLSDPKPEQSSPVPQNHAEPINYLPFDFDDIEPFEVVERT